MIATMTGSLIVSPVQAFWMMMIGQAVLTTIFTQIRLIAIFRETYTTIYATMTMISQAFLTTTGAVLAGMIGLQVGLMIGEVVRGTAGAVPVGIAKLGL
ncbi:hypothetical protein THERU_04430 [Thermocrinis ruber]|uniref:ABC transporter permease n=1 Tax=Thermocrinis ruber TaxID=75906 RepID=W0DHW5_9AQUI|nr:hypothetical protein THERU_04430 [Thermocrinis ruber]